MLFEECNGSLLFIGGADLLKVRLSKTVGFWNFEQTPTNFIEIDHSSSSQLNDYASNRIR